MQGFLSWGNYVLSKRNDLPARDKANGAPHFDVVARKRRRDDHGVLLGRLVAFAVIWAVLWLAWEVLGWAPLVHE